MTKSKSFKSLADLKDIDLFDSKKLHSSSEPIQKNNQSNNRSNVTEVDSNSNAWSFPGEVRSIKIASSQGTADQEESYQKRLSWINRRESDLSNSEAELVLAQKTLTADRKSLDNSKSYLEKEKLKYKNQLDRLSQLDSMESRIIEREKFLNTKVNDLSEKEKELKIYETKLTTEIKKIKNNEKKVLKESELLNLAIKRQGKTLKEITAELKRTSILNKSLNQQIKDSKKRLLQAQIKIEALEVESQDVSDKPNMKFDNFELIQFLIKNGSTARQLGYLGNKIAICGDGPWHKKDFNDFLKAKGFTPMNPSNSSVDIAVVGRDFNEEEVESQLIAREGKKIHFYSQELLLACIAAKQNPLNNPDSYDDLLKEFAVDHPGLRFLMDNFDFPWPLPNISDSVELVFYSDGLVEQSPLVSMGYHVGIERGLEEGERRKILSNSFSGAYDHLKKWFVDSDEYMARWGKPNSRRRLFQMSHHIHALILNRRSNPSMKYAVQDWKDDLVWLKKFYKPYMSFKWPILK